MIFFLKENEEEEENVLFFHIVVYGNDDDALHSFGLVSMCLFDVVVSYDVYVCMCFVCFGLFCLVFVRLFGITN